MSRRFGERAALVCLPLTLAPPLLMVGQYGITVTEMVCAGAGMVLLLSVRRPGARIPPAILFYLSCYVMGWLGSLYNAGNWQVPVGPWNLSFMYLIVMSLLAFVAGRYSRYSLEEIVSSRVMTVAVVAVAIMAAAYPLMSVGMRHVLFRPFLDTTDIPRLGSPRFPGIGINANQYSFMVFVLFLFSFDGYLRRKTSGLVPLGALIIILMAASRTVTVLTIGSTLVLLARNYRRVDPRRALARFWPAASRRRILFVVGLLFATAGAGVVYGSRVKAAFVLYARFEDMLGVGESSQAENARVSGLNTRTDVWAIGYRRVKLAPVLGVTRDPTKLDDANPLYFYTPHNEFIFMWTMFGMLGLFAHVYLIGHLVGMNVGRRAELRWLMLYGGMVVQMTFDAVFQGPRVVVFAFLIIGLNYKYFDGAPAMAAERVPLGATGPDPVPS